jgi:hypothetical protein
VPLADDGSPAGSFGVGRRRRPLRPVVFAIVARHFIDEAELTDLLARQPEQDETQAQALVLQVKSHDYSSPSRERILDWQAHQTFPIIPNADDPDAGNLYRDLKFPDGVYEHIKEYYVEKAEGKQEAASN